ncbi:MAG: hypothetical protein KL863_05170 [Rhizobium sp.]|nr:hypothetical protein [Rhizobium sp.]
MTNQMSVHAAVVRWLEGKMTIFQVQEACGHASVGEMYDMFMDIEADVREASRMVTSEEAERDELMDLAYQIYADILHEEPGYLDQVVEGLQKQRRRNLARFAARFNARCRGSDGANVVAFVRH